MSIALLGYTAAAFSGIVFLPQVIQTVKTKNTSSLSLTSFLLLNITNIMWMTYGLFQGEMAIIASQSLLIPMGIIILLYKIKYK